MAYGITKFLLWGLILSSLLPLYGQGKTYQFYNLGISNGLSSQNFNWYINQDHIGYIWISSANGINRYDGWDIYNYSPDESTPNSLADPNITSPFFEDRNGDLWFSSASALQRYIRKEDNFRAYQISGDQEFYQSKYYLIDLDTTSNHLWVRIQDTLFVQSFDGNSNQTVHRSIHDLNVLCKLVKDPKTKDKILICPRDSKSGLYIQRFRDLDTNGPSSIIMNNYKISSVHYENGTNCWVGTDKGLFQLNIETGAYQRLGSYSSKIIDFVDWKMHSFIVATQNDGLYIVDRAYPNNFTPLNAYKEDGTSSFNEKVTHLYLAPDNTLWISTAGRGVYLINLSKNRFRTVAQYQLGATIGASYFQSLTQDSNRLIWGLTQDGIYVFDKLGYPIRYTIQYQGSGLFEGQQPYYIYSDQNNRIWAGYQTGLFLLEEFGEELESVPVNNSSNDNTQPFLFVKEVSGRRLLASSLNGLYEIKAQGDLLMANRLPILGKEGRGFTWILDLETLPYLMVRSVQEEFLLTSKSGNIEIKKSIPFKPFINFLVEDPNRKKTWIATSQGLHWMDLSSDSFHIQQDTCFPFQTVKALQLDPTTGQLWAGTQQGLVRYQPPTDTSQSSYQIYTAADGVQNGEFVFWSAITLQDGTMAFGGTNGVTLFKPWEIDSLPIQATPVITDVQVNEKSLRNRWQQIVDGDTIRNLEYLEKLTLSYRENSLTFYFAPLDYSEPRSNKFRYRIREIQSDWIETDGVNFAKYPNLAPGWYTFELRAANSDGVFAPDVRQVRIRIRPPWYLQTWFKIVLSLAGVGLLYLVYRVRISRIRREAENEKREASFKQRVAETESAVRRLQMKPHFIFNSMASIKAYLMNEEVAAANAYLDHLSGFMRKILEYGDKTQITISQEIEIVEDYLELEKMRFSDQFTYDIVIVPPLDPDDYILPSMLLQPFLENALIYGIKPKPHPGHIDIRFSLESDRLHCTVTDNGVGRAYARAHLQRPGNHTSKATEITRRRLALLPSPPGSPPSLEIEDLVDDEGNARGTEVRIIVPI